MDWQKALGSAPLDWGLDIENRCRLIILGTGCTVSEDFLLRCMGLPIVVLFLTCCCVYWRKKRDKH